MKGEDRNRLTVRADDGMPSSRASEPLCDRIRHAEHAHDVAVDTPNDAPDRCVEGAGGNGRRLVGRGTGVSVDHPLTLDRPFCCTYRRAVSTPVEWRHIRRCIHCHSGSMITEHVILPVIAGQEEQFETAFTRAQNIIASMPGFRGLTLSRCLERPSTYLLLVDWAELEDHTIVFRGSVEYEEWRELLHRFYNPFPVVEHFQTVSAVGRTDGPASQRPSQV